MLMKDRRVAEVDESISKDQPCWILSSVSAVLFAFMALVGKLLEWSMDRSGVKKCYILYDLQIWKETVQKYI